MRFSIKQPKTTLVDGVDLQVLHLRTLTHIKVIVRSSQFSLHDSKEREKGIIIN